MKCCDTGAIVTRSSSRHARRVLGDDGEDHVLLVQHLVVLEVVQQRGRRELGIAGEEHRGARHDVRRLLLQAVQQRLERHLGLARLVGKDARAAPPGQDQQHHGDAEQQRHPGAFQQLEQVGGEEVAVDDDERHHQQRRLPAGQCHSFQITMKPSMPSTTMVVATAMP